MSDNVFRKAFGFTDQRLGQGKKAAELGDSSETGYHFMRKGGCAPYPGLLQLIALRPFDRSQLAPPARRCCRRASPTAERIRALILQAEYADINEGGATTTKIPEQLINARGRFPKFEILTNTLQLVPTSRPASGLRPG